MAQSKVKDQVKVEVVAEATKKERNIVIVDDCTIKQVSSPSTIQRVAVDKGVNPQEVYVRVTFEYKGKEFLTSLDS